MAETTKKTTTPKKPATKTVSAKTTAPAAIATKTAPAKKKAVKSKIVVMISHEEIATLAHRFWAERGGYHGHHEEDWLRAEQELLGKAS
jgi:ABC-type uncharacterized transport system auxiliary subunit